jgi:hypothetical protein
MSRFIQIIGQISRLRCASLEMTTKWIPARKPPILPSLLKDFDLIMQNKANFRKSQMNVNLYNTTDYENKSDWTLGENKANTKPIKANLLDAQMNVSSILTKDYRKKDDFAVQKNKPNSNPMSKQLVGARPRWPESAKMAHQRDIGKIENIASEKANFLHPNSLYSSKQYFHVSGTSFAHLEPMR